MHFFRRRQPVPTSNVSKISVHELQQRLRRGEPTLILDVRQPIAYAEFPGLIPGSVRIAPSEIPERYGELPRDHMIVTYCT